MLQLTVSEAVSIAPLGLNMFPTGTIVSVRVLLLIPSGFCWILMFPVAKNGMTVGCVSLPLVEGLNPGCCVPSPRPLSPRTSRDDPNRTKPNRTEPTQVLQVLADVFQAPVFTAAASDSAAVGAALRAKHGVACLQRGVSYFPFAEVYG